MYIFQISGYRWEENRYRFVLAYNRENFDYEAYRVIKIGLKYGYLSNLY